MPQWGADNANTAQEPSWGYLADQFRGSQANVNPTSRGWEVTYPNGMTEVLVAIGGLLTSLSVASVRDISGAVGHSNNETLKVFVQMNYGVVIADANSANVYVVASSDVANTANLNLVYVPSLSTPESGELVFQKANVDLSGYGANAHFTIGTLSTLHGAVGVVARKPTHDPTLTAANSAPFTSGNVVITTV